MFEEMISKKLIEWIWLGASVVFLIAGISMAMDADSGGATVGRLVIVVLGLGLIRVFAESMMVIFTINDNLRRSRIAQEQMLENQSRLNAHLQVLSNRTTVAMNPSIPAQPRELASAATVNQRSEPADEWDTGVRLKTPRMSTGFDGAYSSHSDGSATANSKRSGESHEIRRD